MDKYQAEKIVKEYGGAMGKVSNDRDVFRRCSNLPCSKAKIRYAFYVLIDAVINEQGSLSEEIGQSLVALYSALDSFVQDEDADRLNEVRRALEGESGAKQRDPEQQKITSEYWSLVPNALRNGNYADEIKAYIEECYRATRNE